MVTATNDRNMMIDANQLFFRFFVYYPLVWARGQPVPAYLKALSESQYLPAAEVRALQLSKLKRLIEHARGFV